MPDETVTAVNAFSLLLNFPSRETDKDTSFIDLQLVFVATAYIHKRPP